MERNPADNDRRRDRQRQRFGDDGSCVLCGCQNLAALTEVRVTLLEEHHLAGRKADPELTVAVCLNCHRVLQEGLKDAGLEARYPDNAVERAQARSIGVADFFRLAVDSFRRQARELQQLMNHLDQELPDWRDMARDELEDADDE